MTRSLLETFHDPYERALSVVSKVTQDEKGRLSRVGIRHHQVPRTGDEPVTRDVYFATPRRQLRKSGVEWVGMRMMLRLMHEVDSVMNPRGIHVYSNGRLQAGLELHGGEEQNWLRVFRAIDIAEVECVEESETPILYAESGHLANLEVATLEQIDPAAAVLVAAVVADMDARLAAAHEVIGD